MDYIVSIMPQLLPSQIRAARALLRLSQEKLAEAVGIMPATLSAIERGVSVPRDPTSEAIRAVLEARGIVFLTGEEKQPPGKGAGVQLAG